MEEASGGKIAVVQAILEAWNRDDLESALSHIHPEAVLLPVRAQLEGIEYHGRDGFAQLHKDVNEDWEGLRITMLDLHETGDRVVARSTLTATGRASGVELEVPLGWVIEVQDGKVIRSQTYSDPDEAFREAGLDPG